MSPRRAALVLCLFALPLSSACETEPLGPVCGDSLPALPERCDDGNTINGDGCSATCVIEIGYICEGIPSACRFDRPDPVCGNGTIEEGEECDDGRETGDCNFDCTLGRCGDGYQNLIRGEACDDSNTLDLDGCSRMCQIEELGCGNGVCTANETCTGCPADCSGEERCFVCIDRDGDGATDSACGGDDCNDFDITIGPGMTEIPCNLVDEDCDPSTPDALDEDNDMSSCNFDCDDQDRNRSPFLVEVCGNGIDDDCDPSTIDIMDVDGDGTPCGLDCDDNDPNVCPGCTEICDNGIDDDCDPTTGDSDSDGDGDCALDCDDSDPLVNSFAVEICGDAIDDDCDPATDLIDADNDGEACDIDCDDNNMAIVPDTYGFCDPAFSYFEDFEAGDGGWTTSGTASTWEHGAPNNTFISDAASGTNAWVTNLDGDYAPDELSYLESPAFDFSTLVGDPTLVFAHRYSAVAGSDGGWLEVSRDGGAFERLGAVGEGIGWYNQAASQEWSGTSNSSGWQGASHVLTGTAGFSSVRLRFVMRSDADFHAEGFGIDDVQITNRDIDVEVLQVLVAAGPCGEPALPVVVRLINHSERPVRNFDLTYQLAGGAAVTETVTRPIAVEREAMFTFVQPLDFTVGGSRVLTVTANMPGDATPSNDSATVTLSSARTVVVPPAGYSEDFEADDGGFVGEGTWAWGEPGGSDISAAANGTNAWVTSLSGDYANSQDISLTSACFDFSALSADPTLSFSHIFETESGFDETFVEYWTEAMGWRRLGSGTSGGTNWYGSSNDWDGSSGGWRTASHPLMGTAGQRARVRWRLQPDGSSTEEGVGVDDVVIAP